MKTITQSEIQKLLNDGFNVRNQSNGLVFVGKKIETTLLASEGKKYAVLREEVFRLVTDRNRVSS